MLAPMLLPVTYLDATIGRVTTGVVVVRTPPPARAPPPRWASALPTRQPAKSSTDSSCSTRGTERQAALARRLGAMGVPASLVWADIIPLAAPPSR